MGYEQDKYFASDSVTFAFSLLPLPAVPVHRENFLKWVLRPKIAIFTYFSFEL